MGANEKLAAALGSNGSTGMSAAPTARPATHLYSALVAISGETIAQLAYPSDHTFVEGDEVGSSFTATLNAGLDILKKDHHRAGWFWSREVDSDFILTDPAGNITLAWGVAYRSADRVGIITIYDLAAADATAAKEQAA